MQNAIYTVGHSTRPIEDFIQLLQTYGIETLVDVRKIAKSRHNPQYGEGALRQSLNENAMTYKRFEGLGGLRRTTAESINIGWRNMSFRAYADHMQTAEFSESLEKLIAHAINSQTVIMCAEAVPWRCHRSLIGDALVVRGIDVEDILSVTRCTPHKLTPFANVQGTVITYPALP